MIPITRYDWSSENHSLGRARGAIGLLERLFAEGSTGHSRVLIMTHSHGGNVVAMLSHLLTASPADRKEFIERVGIPVSRELLEFASGNRDLAVTLDVVNFGTPLRYRWNTCVCNRLLHFVHHRATDPVDPLAIAFPPSWKEVYEARSGDYVQLFGINGTDVMGLQQLPDHRERNRAIQSMYENNADLSHRKIWERLKCGRRNSLDGLTLLVDYPDDTEQWNRKMLGHAIYTSVKWLPFHLRQVCNRFYC